MANIRGLSRAQTRFLRKLRQSAESFPADQWPSPLIMRRWMNNSNFHKVLLELLDAINFQADLHLARATARAANHLPETFLAPSPAIDAHALLATVRLSHYHRNSVRRYRKEPKPTYQVDPELLAKLRRAQAAAIAQVEQTG